MEVENGKNRNGGLINSREICRSLLGQRIMHNARRSGTDERWARKTREARKARKARRMRGWVARGIGDGGPNSGHMITYRYGIKVSLCINLGKSYLKFGSKVREYLSARQKSDASQAISSQQQSA